MKTSALIALGLFLIFALVASIKVEAEFFKHLQGPPEEFAFHRLPDPALSALTSDSAMFPAYLEESEGEWKYQGTLPIDSTEEFSLTVISRLKNLIVNIAKQDEPTKFMPLQNFRKTQIVNGWFGWNEFDSAPATTYTISTPTTGTYLVQIISKEAPTTTNKPSIFLLLNNRSPLRIFSHLGGDYQQLMINQDVKMMTRLYDQAEFGLLLNQMNVSHHAELKTPILPRAIQGVTLTADMDIIMPDGEEKIITMHDDGLNGDFGVNDGVFAGSFKATQEGTYTTQVVMRGVTPQGDAFVRTTTHVFNVVENDGLVIQDTASATIDPADEMMKIYLRVKHNADAKPLVVGQKYHAYAEVYGTSLSNQNQQVPVAFVSGMAIAEEAGDNMVTFELQLSMKWLSRASATLPIQLRNMYLQESANNVPVAQRAEGTNVETQLINLKDAKLKNILQSAVPSVKQNFARNVVNDLIQTKFSFAANAQPTEEMTFGKRPAKYSLDALRGRNSTNGGTLVLVHGYCAADCPFETSHFTNFAVFKDFKQSRKTDEFALLIREFADSLGPFSLAAHSHGGLASLHLKTYYWSAADGGNVNDNDHRVIQSVGSPYRGSALAGDLAAIGDIIGVGCGTNVDLTRDGAQLWLSGIPKSARSFVYYYTTQYKDWSWCNMAANLVLDWPNDGVAEYDYSILDGGNSQPHIKGQCHSVGMKYDPQCKNPTRNAEINSKAARGL
jgi:ADP-dependent glucokinase